MTSKLEVESLNTVPQWIGRKVPNLMKNLDCARAVRGTFTSFAPLKLFI